MKATIDIPDDLYRKVKAKSALEGRPVRDVTVQLFRSWLTEADAGTPDDQPTKSARKSTPPWFGALRRYAKNARDRHDMESIRESVARKRTRAKRPTESDA